MKQKEVQIFKRVIKQMGGKSVNEEDVANLISVKADRIDLIELKEIKANIEDIHRVESELKSVT